MTVYRNLKHDISPNTVCIFLIQGFDFPFYIKLLTVCVSWLIYLSDTQSCYM
jgi:hypothetical protein